MALTVLPVCLIPTLKEGAGAAFAGCMGTILGDIIAVSIMMHGMAGHPSPPSPHLTFKQVVSTFGNLSLAYGAGIVIPALQRQHTEPTRMPRVLLVTVGFISCLFLVLASLGYSAVGCQLSGNMLFSIYPNATTGVNTLGFSPHRGSVVMAFLFMQLHITIAFAVMTAPAFYMLERLLLGMHKRKQEANIEAPGLQYERAETPSMHSSELAQQKVRVSANSVVSYADIEKESFEYDEEIGEYQGANVFKCVFMRLIVVVLLVLLSIALEDHFLDLSDFIGASALTTDSILLPILFYLTKFWPTVPMYEKVPACIAAVICLVLGCYVTYTSGKALFVGDDSDVKFPFCDAEYQDTIYYVKNTTRSS